MITKKSNLLMSVAVVMGFLFVSPMGAKATLENDVINDIVKASSQPAEQTKICGDLEKLDGIACKNKVIGAYFLKVCPATETGKCGANATAALAGQAPNDAMTALITQNTVSTMSAQNKATVQAATIVKNLP